MQLKQNISRSLDQLLAAKQTISPKSIKCLFVVGLLFWVPMIIFLTIADEIREGVPVRGDSAVLRFLNTFKSEQLDSAAIILTDTSGPTQMIIIAALIIGVLFYFNRKRAATFLLFSLGGASVINVLLKLFFARDRPDLWTSVVTEVSYSFPSGHAMGSSALAFSIMALLWPTKWRWYAVIVGSIYIILIGLTRLYLGVHYPTDIIAGWSVSLAWVITVKLALDHHRDVWKFVHARVGKQSAYKNRIG